MTTASAVAWDGPDHDVAARFEAVDHRIAEAAGRVGRTAASVTLVAVSKAHPAAAIRAARAAGQLDFGESRAQELRDKATEIGQGVRWHFVGRIQRNKVKDLIGPVSMIHSVDRLDLAESIGERAARTQRVQRVLLQVNAGDDPEKAGCAIDEALGLIAKIRAIPGVACQGLMTIPPLGADPRPVFRRLRELRDQIRAHFPEIQHLSMGMSHDFEIAVEEGATIVRVGTALFGPREPTRDGGR